MTKLDAEQTRLLAQIKDAKAEYDKWEAAAELELAVLKSQQKNALRGLVGRAIEGGIPVRQIHMNGLGYKQVASMTTFLDGGAKLGKAHILGLVQPTIAGTTSEGSALAPAQGKVKVRQDNGFAFWTNPATGEEHKVERQYFPGAHYYNINEVRWNMITEYERSVLRDDRKTLIGDEWDAFYEDGIEPARWADQPDAVRHG